MSGFLYAKLKCLATAERGKIIKCSKIKKCRGKVKRFKAKLKSAGTKCNCIALGYYLDEGHSGKNIKGRPEFMKMLNDIEDGKEDISFVLVFKLSRFRRNASDVLSALQLMQDYGVNLICVEDGIDSSKEAGKLKEAIQSKFGSVADTSDMEKELSVNLANLNQAETIKTRLEKQMDTLDVTDSHYERKINQWSDFSFKLSDGECLKEVQDRNISALNGVLKQYPGKNIVVGSHGTALSTIINYYDRSFGYEDFENIKLLMPWIVEFSFDELGTCIDIKRHSI